MYLLADHSPGQFGEGERYVNRTTSERGMLTVPHPPAVRLVPVRGSPQAAGRTVDSRQGVSAQSEQHGISVTAACGIRQK